MEYLVYSFDGKDFFGEYLGLTAGIEKDGIAYVWFRNKDGVIEYADSFSVQLRHGTTQSPEAK